MINSIGTTAADEVFERHRRRIAKAWADLRLELIKRCPGRHNPVKHRDGNDPWCNVCRRTGQGLYIEHRPERADI